MGRNPHVFFVSLVFGLSLGCITKINFLSGLEVPEKFVWLVWVWQVVVVVAGSGRGV